MDLFHGSPYKTLDTKQIKPFATSPLSPNKSKFFYAFLNTSLASCFIVRKCNTWIQIGKFENGPIFVISPDKNLYTENDIGGCIYKVSSKLFEKQEKWGSRCHVEYITRKEITPNDKIEYDSGVQSMLENGVQVYFLNMGIAETIWLQKDSLYIMNVLNNTESENQKLNINIKPLGNLNLNFYFKTNGRLFL